jgi:hypothetical protein
LFIMAIVAAMAAPRYSQAIARYRLESAAGRVAADLEYARALARSTSTSLKVDFSAPANGYTLVGAKSLDDPAADYAVRLSGDPYGVTLDRARFGTDPDEDARQPHVTFDLFGVPNSGGRVVLRHAGLRKVVRLDALTGKVEVQ